MVQMLGKEHDGILPVPHGMAGRSGSRETEKEGHNRDIRIQ